MLGWGWMLQPFVITYEASKNKIPRALPHRRLVESVTLDGVQCCSTGPPVTGGPMCHHLVVLSKSVASCMISAVYADAFLRTSDFDHDLLAHPPRLFDRRQVWQGQLCAVLHCKAQHDRTVGLHEGD